MKMFMAGLLLLLAAVWGGSYAEHNSTTWMQVPIAVTMFLVSTVGCLGAVFGAAELMGELERKENQ